MPELPDVEYYRRFLQRHGLHKKISGIDVATPQILRNVSVAKLRRALQDRTLRSARRHGKHLLAQLDDGCWLAFHFGMTGRLAYFRDGGEDPKYDRLRFDFSGGEHLAYVNMRLLGGVRLIDDADTFVRDKKLGPDALAVSEQQFADRLSTKRGALKSALMDQTLLAGIGNVYSDEILYHAKIHPATHVGSLDARSTSRLFRTMRRVLETAIAKGAGSQDVERRVPRTWLLARRRKGAACPRCGGKVAVLKMQSRSSYYCPACQPPPKRG